jgi:uncharacterized protein DUF4170
MSPPGDDGCVFHSPEAKPSRAWRKETYPPRVSAPLPEGIDDMTHDEATSHESPQLLHLVFGGELQDLDNLQFRDPAKIDVVGIFPDYASAERAWRGKAQATVDSAQTRYFIVHLHRFLEPKGLVRKPA